MSNDSNLPTTLEQMISSKNCSHEFTDRMLNDLSYQYDLLISLNQFDYKKHIGLINEWL